MLRFNNIFSSLRKFSKISSKEYFVKSNQIRSKKDVIGPMGWFLLCIPTATFGLGTWQIQRKKWKENLIFELHSRSHTKPISLPEDLSELKDLEYVRVKVKGYFLHNEELYMGPRSLLKQGDVSSEGGLISVGQSTNSGYLVVTPFKLSDRDLTILVNRGWVPQKKKNPKTRPSGQITNEVEIVGVIRLNENRPSFMPNNRPEQNSWFYRDLNTMAQITKSAPVFIDIVSECDIDDGPVGGQTRVSLRNEHFSYVLTWYSLCGLTSYMWYKQFIRRLPLR